MKIHNTATHHTEEFSPLKNSSVSFYSCGPTVYDYPHIGNWFAFIRWDTVVRVLRSQEYNVTWVMNITDVGHLVSDNDSGEDKLEKGARREGKSAWDIAKYYGEYFLHGLDRLNLLKPNHLPKATDHIAEQIELIKQLESNGHTYKIDDGIYFDTKSWPKYGQTLTGARGGSDDTSHRVTPNPQKRQQVDFALWKFSPLDKKRDMEWDSPWGKGFPGWHIECSAMSMKYLGKTIDIHSGGIDHIPVHHTNEIAQSEAATGQQFVRYWLHSNFVNVDNQKMSKSLGNLITLEDIENKGIDLLAFRLLVLESHYSSEAHFSWKNLQAAQNRLNTYRSMAELQHQPFFQNSSVDFDKYLTNITTALDNDINTPEALRELSAVASTLNSKLLSTENLDNFKEFLAKIDDLLGLKLLAVADITSQQKELLVKRQAARDNKDWVNSDQLRQALADLGIYVRDTAFGQVWSRITIN